MPNQLEIISICNAHDHFGLGPFLGWHYHWMGNRFRFSAGSSYYGNKNYYLWCTGGLAWWVLMSILGMLQVERSSGILGKDSQALAKPPTSKLHTKTFSCLHSPIQHILKGWRVGDLMIRSPSFHTASRPPRHWPRGWGCLAVGKRQGSSHNPSPFLGIHFADSLSTLQIKYTPHIYPPWN